MKYSIGQMQAGLLTLTIATAMTMVLLLGAVTPANAENLDAVDAAADTAVESVESLARDEQAPSPPTEAAPEAAAAIASGAGGTASAVTQSSSPLPTTTASRVSKLAGDVGQATADVAAPVAKSADPVAPVTGRGKFIERVPGSAQHSLQKTGRTLAETGTTLVSTAASLSRAVAPVHAAADLIIKATAATGEDLPASAGLDARSFPYNHAGSSTGSSTGSLPDGGFPRERVVDILDGLPLRYSAGSEGIEPFQLWAPASSGGDAVAGGASSPMAADTAGTFSAGDGGGPANPAPLNGKGPLQPPESTQAAASGPGGSSFVPIAALLALLALVAPAILRRLREVPDFAAPIPFVCALERPG